MAAKLHYVKMYYDKHPSESSVDSENKVLCSHKRLGRCQFIAGRALWPRRVNLRASCIT